MRDKGGNSSTVGEAMLSKGEMNVIRTRTGKMEINKSRTI